MFIAKEMFSLLRIGDLMVPRLEAFPHLSLLQYSATATRGRERAIAQQVWAKKEQAFQQYLLILKKRVDYIPISMFSLSKAIHERQLPEKKKFSTVSKNWIGTMRLCDHQKNY